MKNAAGLEFAARTDTGLVRSQNEDAIAISPAHGFALLADGMGGYSAGEVASGIAIAVTQGALEEVLARSDAARLQRNNQLHQAVIDAIQRANTAILDAAREEPDYSGMGTTLVAAVFHGDSLTIAHVGDSRAYRFRDGEIEQITRDHSVLQEQIDAGLIDPELARFSHQKNLVTRAVGVAAEMEVEIHDHQTQAGDMYLLCSDGLSDLLATQEMRDILVAHQASLDAACDALVQRANDNGGYDNISVVLARVRSTEAPPAGLLGRILNWIG
jgi:PPM family protein phosphatase